jgi:hypothetical protein
MSEQDERPSLLGYFRLFMKNCNLPSKVVLISFFIVTLITPLYGKPPTEGGEGYATTSIGFIIFTVQAGSILVLFMFNRSLPDNYVKTGRNAIYLIALPVVLMLMASIFAAFDLNIFDRYLNRVLASLAITVPLLIVVVLLVQSVLQDKKEKVSYLPALLIFSTFILIIYTFATVFFINGYVLNADGHPGNFFDALYVSGQAFTTLGFSTAQPSGIGEGLAVFEALCGYIVLSLLTAVFLQIMFKSR